jgi:hypothetical protein
MEALLAGMTSLMELSYVGRGVSSLALHRAASAANVVAGLSNQATGQIAVMTRHPNLSALVRLTLIRARPFITSCLRVDGTLLTSMNKCLSAHRSRSLCEATGGGGDGATAAAASDRTVERRHCAGQLVRVPRRVPVAGVAARGSGTYLALSA